MSGFLGNLLGEHGPAAQNLLSDLAEQHGGMGGLMDKLNQSGMGSEVQGWLSSGPAGAVVGDVTQVFPPDQLEALAEKHGIPQGMVSGLLAQILPHAVAQAGNAGASGDGGDDSAS